VLEFCRQQGYPKSGAPFPFADASLFWIKYGYHVTMDEAATQVKIGRLVNTISDTAVFVPEVYVAFEHERMGYIVMEYIRGSNSNMNKLKLPKVAAAVQQLASIPSDRILPGILKHSFFYRWSSAVPYASVQDLQAHINRLR
jgi:hypothetical protein